MKSKSFFTVLALAACLALGGCANTESGRSSVSDNSQNTSTDNQSSTPGHSTDDTVRSITLCESWGFDSGFYPLLHAGNASNFGISYWGHNFYDTLVKYENGEYKGSIADKWEISEDGKEYTFTLKNGILFSDGTPCNSAAVKKSLDAALVNLGQFNGSYGKLTTLIDTIETPDETTLVLKLSQPYYGTINDLSMCNPLAIVNPNAFNDDLTVKDDLKTMTMGTGPYMYNGDFDGTTYTFVRNPNYHGEKPEADTFKVKVIEDNDAKVLALRSGEVDIIVGAARLSADGYIELTSDPAYGTAVNSEPTLTNYLGFNMSKAPFDDKNVRLAVAYAVDNNTIAENVFRGTQTAAETLFDRSKPYCDVDTVTYEFNADKAKSLLDEAGWKDTDGDGVRDKDGQNLEINFVYTSSYGSIGDGMLAVASELETVGFKVNVADMDMMAFYTATLGGEYDMTLYRTYGGVFDPLTLMTNIYPETSMDPVAKQFAAFIPGGADTIKELDSTADMNRVAEIYGQALPAIADNALCVPLTSTIEYAAWNNNIINGYDFCSDSQYVEISGIDLK